MRWDLTIFDEAHLPSGPDESHNSQRYQLRELLRDNADHVLLVTATSHKGDPQNFPVPCRASRGRPARSSSFAPSASAWTPSGCAPGPM